MTGRLTVAIVVWTLVMAIGCAHRSAAPPPAPSVVAATYEPVTFQRVEAQAAGQLKGAKVELRGRFDRVYNNPYWAKRFPAEQWVQFWLMDENTPGQSFQNVFVRQSDATEIVDATQGVIVVVRGMLDHNGAFPFLTAISARVVK